MTGAPVSVWRTRVQDLRDDLDEDRLAIDEEIERLWELLEEAEALFGTGRSYSLAEIRNGTGWPRGQRFIAAQDSSEES